LHGVVVTVVQDLAFGLVSPAWSSVWSCCPVALSRVFWCRVGPFGLGKCLPVSPEPMSPLAMAKVELAGSPNTHPCWASRPAPWQMMRLTHARRSGHAGERFGDSSAVSGTMEWPGTGSQPANWWLQGSRGI